MKRKVVLAIGGSDTCGGAGIQADIKALASLRVHGATAITAVTDQTTKTVYGLKRLALDFIGSQIDHVLSDLQPAAIKTGILYDTATVRLVGEKIRASGLPAVIDPVMVATVGKELFKNEYQFNIILKESLDVRYKPFVAALKKYLLPYATLVAPNVNEACHLVGWKLRTLEDVKLACKTIADTGCKFVLVKGGHMETEKGKAIDVLYDSKKKKFYEYEAPRINARFHGSGCTYASLIAGYIALGNSVPEAVGKAKKNIADLMQNRYELGPLEVLAPFTEKPECASGKNAMERKIIDKLESAVAEVERILPPEYVAEVGINFGYAKPNPKRREDVCALEGRIIKVGNRVAHLGCAKFGASKHVANIILAACSFGALSRDSVSAACAAERQIRSAMNIRYRPETIEECRKIFTIGSFDRAKEPRSREEIERWQASQTRIRGEEEPDGISSMEWGTAQAIKGLGKVPDIVWDAGGIGKEPMIRILGKNPADVVAKLKKLLKQRRMSSED